MKNFSVRFERNHWPFGYFNQAIQAEDMLAAATEATRIAKERDLYATTIMEIF